MRMAALVLLGAVGVMAASVASANAAPIIPAIPAPEVSNIVPVAQGCGRGFHRNYRRFCVPNGVYRPHAYYPRYNFYGGGNEFLNRPSPNDYVANRLNAREAGRPWGYWGY
jgi:hypothetical protein